MCIDCYTVLITFVLIHLIYEIYEMLKLLLGKEVIPHIHNMSLANVLGDTVDVFEYCIVKRVHLFFFFFYKILIYCNASGRSKVILI